MSNEEIQHMLKGIKDDVPADELPAVMFAQHYADTRANPTQKSWKRLLEIYGISKSYGILGTIRTIMIGNTFGIPWSSFFNRLRGKADPRSSITYELTIMLSSVLMLISFFHALISNLIKRPIIVFEGSRN
jgi:hypothetical protein